MITNEITISVGTIVLAVATVALAILTGIYAGSTHGILKEQREAAKRQIIPYLTIDVTIEENQDRGRGNFSEMLFIIENGGLGPAIDITVEVISDPPGKVNKIHFPHSIQPGQSRKVRWLGWPDWLIGGIPLGEKRRVLTKHPGFDKCYVDVKYSNLYGNSYSLPERKHIDLNEYLLLPSLSGSS